MLDENNIEIDSTTTDGDGNYRFDDISAGNYTVQVPPPFVPPTSGYNPVSDQDNSNDGDASDSDTTVDTRVAVTLTPGETDADNDFVFEIPGEIRGNVSADTNGDGIADTPISGVTLELLDGMGNPIDSNPNMPGVQPTTTVTGSNGDYAFFILSPNRHCEATVFNRATPFFRSHPETGGVVP